MSRGLLLASGGMDSTTLAYQLVRDGVEVTPCFVDYGQHCSARELSAVQDLLPKEVLSRLQVIDVRGLYAHSNSAMIKARDLWEVSIEPQDLYLPYRNLLLLSIGASLAQSLQLHAVYAAFINTNHAVEIDCSAVFFDQLSNVLASYGTIKVQLPFREMSKSDVAALGITLGVPIASTFSCQAAPEIPCGACPNCVERSAAIREVRSRS